MKIKTTILSLLISSFAISANAEIVTRIRTVVDTVQAMKMISKKYDTKNAPINNSLNAEERILKDKEYKLQNLSNQESQIKNLLQSAVGKIKDSQQIEKIYDYVSRNMNNVPESVILSFCNPKKVNKASNNNAKLQEMKDKKKEEILKKAAKGDFSSGNVTTILNYFYLEKRKEIDKLSNTISEHKETIRKLKGKLVSAPKSFSAEMWKKECKLSDIPLRTFTERRERRNTDDLSFPELATKYYTNPGMDYINRNYKEHFCEGRFNEFINDRLGLFPENLIINEKDNMVGFNWGKAGRIKIISEKGSVPDLYLSIPNKYGELEPLTLFSGNGESRFSIKALPKFYFPDKLQIKYSAGEIGEGEVGVVFTAIYELINDEWKLISLTRIGEGEYGEEISEKWDGYRWVAYTDTENDYTPVEPEYTHQWSYSHPFYGELDNKLPASVSYVLNNLSSNLSKEEVMALVSAKYGVNNPELIKDSFTLLGLPEGDKITSGEKNIVNVKPLGNSYMVTLRDPKTGKVNCDIIGRDGKMLDRIWIVEKDIESEGWIIQSDYKANWLNDRLLEVEYNHRSSNLFHGKGKFRYLVTDKEFIVMECSRDVPVVASDFGTPGGEARYYGVYQTMESFIKHFPKSAPSFEQLKAMRECGSIDGELGEDYLFSFFQQVIDYNPNAYFNWILSKGEWGGYDPVDRSVEENKKLRRDILAYPDKDAQQLLMNIFFR